MTLSRVQVTDFRCLASAGIDLDPLFTFISGPNASGKTSVLEAIHVLGRGRSFRTRRLDKLIRSGTPQFLIFGETSQSGRLTGLGIEGSAIGMRARMDRVAVSSLTELAALLPVQIIDPEVHRLIEEGPSRRRRFLDWGVFHVEHGFARQWQSYRQVLKQRNAALKSRLPRSVVAAWNGELLRLGGVIDAARTEYVRQLLTASREIVSRMLGLEIGLRYRHGWAQDLTFEGALNASAGQEAELGTTLVGPQRAELSILLGGQLVKERISRGQQKLLAAALLIAQLSLFRDDSDVRPTLLLDDPAAELDGDRLLGLIGEVARQRVQLVVTSLNPDFAALGTPGSRYTIDSGVLRLV